MNNLNEVAKNIKQYAKIALVILTLVTTISCCPKDGVDRSFQDNSFNVTLDIYNQNAQQKIECLDHDSKLSLIMNNSVRMNSQNFSQDSSIRNRLDFTSSACVIL